MILNGARVSHSWNLSPNDGKQFGSNFNVGSGEQARVTALRLMGDDTIFVLRIVVNINDTDKPIAVHTGLKLTPQQPTVSITEQGEYRIAREIDLSTRRIYAQQSDVIVEVFQGCSC